MSSALSSRVCTVGEEQAVNCKIITLANRKSLIGVLSICQYAVITTEPNQLNGRNYRCTMHYINNKNKQRTRGHGDTYCTTTYSIRRRRGEDGGWRMEGGEGRVEGGEQ
jgi:hypothetical protein